MDFRSVDSGFSGSSTPAGVTLEVVTTPADAVIHFEVVIEGLGLPPEAGARLLHPVQRAREQLTDADPANDRGACDLLGGFVRELDALERELLGAPPAWHLRQLALNLLAGLGCPRSAG